MQETWQDVLHRGVQHRDGHYVIDVDYLEDQAVGRGAQYVLQRLGDVRDLRWHGTPRIKAALRRLDALARAVPDVWVSGSLNVAPTGEEFVMPGGRFGATFGTDGITGVPGQHWPDTETPPGVVVKLPEPTAKPRVIMLPELGAWEWAKGWVHEAATLRDAASRRGMPTLRQRFWLLVWPRKICNDYLREEAERQAAAERQRSNASWPGRAKSTEARPS